MNRYGYEVTENPSDYPCIPRLTRVPGLSGSDQSNSGNFLWRSVIYEKNVSFESSFKEHGMISTTTQHVHGYTGQAVEQLLSSCT
jgi:hypothetical protein